MCSQKRCTFVLKTYVLNTRDQCVIGPKHSRLYRNSREIGIPVIVGILGIIGIPDYGGCCGFPH